MLKDLKLQNTPDALIEYDNVMEAISIYNVKRKHTRAENVPVKELIEAALKYDLMHNVKFAPKSTALEIQKSIIEEFKVLKNNCTSDPKQLTNEKEDLLLVPMVINDIPIIATFTSKAKDTKSFVDFMFWLDKKSMVTKTNKVSDHGKAFCMNIWETFRKREEKLANSTGYAPVSESNTTIKDILSL